LDELDKGTIDQQYEALNSIKSHIHENIEEAQKIIEEQSNSLASKAEKIKQ
jgi:hypothetical protein